SNVAQYLQSLWLRGIQQAPAANATFTDVANKMLAITAVDAAAGRITAAQATAYRTFIRNRFLLREMVLSNVPFAETGRLADEWRRDVGPEEQLQANPHVSTDPNAAQNRTGCCGTMTLPENNGLDEAMEREKQKFLEDIKALAAHSSHSKTK